MPDLGKVAVFALVALTLSACAKAIVSPTPNPVPQTGHTYRFQTVWETQMANLPGHFHSFGSAGVVCDIRPDGGVVVVDPDTGAQSGQVSVGSVKTGAACTENLRFVIDSFNRLTAYSADGRHLWEKVLRGSVAGQPVLVPESDAVLIQDGSGRIASYDAESGRENWIFTVPLPVLRIKADAGLVLAENLLLAGMPNGKLYAIDYDNGFDLWEVATAVPSGGHEIVRIVHVNPAVPSGSVACVTAYQGTVSCIDLDSGRSIWSKAFSSKGRPAIVGGAVVAVDGDDVLHAFSLNNGTDLWTSDTFRHRELRLLGASGGLLLAGDFEGYLYAIQPQSGEIAATGRIAGDTIMSMLGLADETFLVRSVDGILSGIRLEAI